MSALDQQIRVNVDLRQLADMFAGNDERIPAIVFALLRHFYAAGPFPFDAEALSRVLTRPGSETRVNPTQVADLQNEIERYFERGPNGLVPRAGVLA